MERSTSQMPKLGRFAGEGEDYHSEIMASSEVDLGFARAVAAHEYDHLTSREYLEEDTKTLEQRQRMSGGPLFGHELPTVIKPKRKRLRNSRVLHGVAFLLVLANCALLVYRGRQWRAGHAAPQQGWVAVSSEVPAKMIISGHTEAEVLELPATVALGAGQHTLRFRFANSTAETQQRVDVIDGRTTIVRLVKPSH